ncbi:50S ribosome-binding GTPase [Aeromonas veronii]|uniref:Labile enterotoxin output A n=1 Tax=Aeromonas veronii TaxID=654 RepID=A0AAN1UNL7_AERVE|nr:MULTISPECIES: LeoA/HP0731 family dynamin-like GTPase [Aeromonas]AYV35935.1 labile enterotoxin output A [Aeromonas veronii]KZW95252.1 labile enterotoxin output A [Aeromonas veronii]MBJ7581076.1 50S ribosome-binding GTPase [Aeromonas veronii]MBJ7590715.1 50S ribosome-binding GTPase [Aeromonas veronii]MCF5865646.1 50S ribosome-binding GTPase [Aeromonas veronii]
MKDTLNTFKGQQNESLELLNRLSKFLTQGEKAGVPIDQELRSKLQTAIQSVSGERLKVALIGGFSEGKTSIAAAWMEQLDKSSMKISHSESSNEVKVYEVGEDFVLIDTPGLFGFKEKYNAEKQAIEKYKDITKKYVSEAHLVLYVMNPTNPIKESHEDDLAWLFRSLGLLPRTVFVLSRFDEVADVEDEDDYRDNLKVKYDNVVGRLRAAIELDDEEEKELSVVAVAANPFDLGADHWLQNPDEFKELSHITELQAETAQKIHNNGGAAALAEEMRASVIRDVLSKQLPIAIENDQKISQEVTKLDELNSHLKLELATTERDIEDARIELREFVVRYFSDLILKAKGCSLETFGDFFEREIGSEGIVIATRLQNEFSRQVQPITLEVEKMQIGFDNEVSHFNTTIKSLGKQGVNHVLNGKFINKDSVLAARDGIVNVAKSVGVDLGKYLKFKPWGATKFAKGANGALAAVGLAFELWDSWEEHKRQTEFQNAIAKMVSNFEKQREELLTLINSVQFKEMFFGNYIELRQQVVEVGQMLNQRREIQQKFQAWKSEAEAIKVDFKRMG